LQDDGQLLGHVNLPIEMNDFEDLDQAPCPHLPRPCLWVGDFGDNQKQREWISIYAFAEPLIQGEFDPINLDPTDLFVLHLTYPDHQAYDVESLVVDHLGTQLWLIEKTSNPQSKVWSFTLDNLTMAHPHPLIFNPESDDSNDYWPRSLTEVAQWPSPGIEINQGRMVTGADLSPDGSRLLVRVYTGVYEYRFASPYQFRSLPTLSPLQVRLGPLSEPQGEAISYGWQGEGIWTLSEDENGNQPIHYQGCE
jgi:hypothetical protein